jgi:hypothetical protein
MRFRFPDPDDAREKKARQKTERAIGAWWKALAAKVDDLDALFSQKKQWDLPKFMDKHLGAIDRRLMWEFGRALRGKGHRLVITPESEHALRPLVDEVLARAPKLRKLELYAHRVAEPIAMVAPTVEARLSRALPETRVVVSPGEHGTIDLLFLMDGCQGEEDDDALAIAFVTAETLLGEKVLDEDIGTLLVAPQKKQRGAIPVEKLRAEVGRAIAARNRSLPSRPCRARLAKTKWSLFKNEPTRAKDYSHQHDIFVAVTMWPELWAATHSDTEFHSGRFSRHGELFAYVKIDGSKGLAGSAFEDREDIENAIAATLAPKLGCVIGGGTGLRYSYVELALEDADRAIPRIRRALQKGKLPLRSWLLFHDVNLQDEWVGIYPKTPKPPT